MYILQTYIEILASDSHQPPKMVRCKFSIFFLLSLLPLIATAAGICPESFCGILPVKFPFRLTNSTNPATDRCMYPGFGISCGPNRSAVITLPNFGQYTVSNIDYDIQSLWINDPDNCLPKRFLDDFSLRDSPFYPEFSGNYTFLNCSSTTQMTSSRHIRVDCMSDGNHTVFATPTVFYDDSSAELASSCEEIGTVLVPVSFGSWLYGLQVDVQLSWSVPLCGFCDYAGRACGFRSDSGLEIRCFNSGRSNRPNFRVIIAVGLPILACIIGVGFFLAKIRAHNRHQGSNTTTTELSNSIVPRPHIIMAGLDAPTIESYPKTLLGESRRLPKPSDNTCPICLCEYQPKESLRTLPKCNHYFHAGCIDEWLRVNASCPLCRNLPPELVVL